MDALRLLKALAKFYGPLAESGEPRDPFGLIVWENVGYLVDDSRRREAFEALRDAIGIEPQALLDAGPVAIERSIARGGMLSQRRAENVLRCAQIAVADARGKLERFPGIGEPGAAKIMLLAGLSDEPALDSNGVRVVERICGFAALPAYARSYRRAIASLRAGGVKSAKEACLAFERLRQHGRSLCRRAHPRCTQCPIVTGCAFGRKSKGVPLGVPN